MSRRDSSRFQAWLLSPMALACTGCGWILGADDYTVSDSPPVPECGPLEVATNARQCEPVGALEGDCPNGFEWSDGSCLPQLPSAPCGDGFTYYPGLTACTDVDVACNPLSEFSIYEHDNPGVYVKPGGSGSGDSPDSPLGTIADGIQHAKDIGKDTVWLAGGEYDEAPIRIDADVNLIGTCPSTTTLRGKAGVPTVELAAGADGVEISYIGMIGGSNAIRVSGAENTLLFRLWIRDLDGPAIVFEGTFDREEPEEPGVLLADGGIDESVTPPAADAGAGEATGGKLEQVAIERVRGSGIEAFGADVELKAISIRDVQPLSDLFPGRGIGLHPSAISHPSWTPRRSVASIASTGIEDVASSGILVEGSDLVELSESTIRDVSSSGDGKGGDGVVVQPRIAANVPATLTARNVLIEQVDGVGVKVWSSRATLDSVTVRDTGRGEGCTGNGIRVRLDTTAEQALGPPPDTEEPLVAISRSVIDRGRESGIHVEGARVELSESIVRGTLPERCDGEHGDGAAAYAIAGGRPTDLRVVRSRVEGNARSGIAAHGATVSITESELGCNARDVSRADETGFSTDEVSRCSACDKAERCLAPAADVTLPPALKGAKGCEEGDVCTTTCQRNWFPLAELDRLEGGTHWFDDDRRAPAFTDRDGCATVTGSPSTLGLGLFSSAPGYAFVLALLPPEDSAVSTQTGLSRWPSFALHTSFVEGTSTYGKAFDFRTGYMVFMFLCDAVDPVVAGEPVEACLGHGIPGVRVELPGHHGRGVYHGPPDGYVSDRNQPVMTEAAGVIWQNVAPGDYTALAHPPEGASGLDCAPWHGDGPPLPSFEGTNPVNIPLRVFPGLSSGRWVTCKVIP